MTPTQAQIDALNECADDLESMINGSYANSLDYPRQKRKYERDLVAVSRAREAIAALTATAEVGEIPLTERERLDATIERCAQVVSEKAGYLSIAELVAAIRALKDKP